MTAILFTILGVLAAKALMGLGFHYDINEAGLLVPCLQEYLLVGPLTLIMLIWAGFCRKGKGMSASASIGVALVTIASLFVAVKLGWQVSHQTVWPTSGSAKIISFTDWQAPFWVYLNLAANSLLFLSCSLALKRAGHQGILFGIALIWSLFALFMQSLAWFWPGALFFGLVLIVSLVVWGISFLFKEKRESRS